MSARRPFESPLAERLEEFLVYKRARGCAYERPEWALRSFDRFVAREATTPDLQMERLVLGWLSSMKQGRKAATMAFYAAIVRQFCLFLRRNEPECFLLGRIAPSSPTQPTFLPHIFTEEEIRTVIALAKRLRGGELRRIAVYTLILVLYCTGLRPGEAVRLRMRDVKLDSEMFFIETFKGRARWVPFGHDLAVELCGYLDVRRRHSLDHADDRFFLRSNGEPLTAKQASDAIRGILRRAGLKPLSGRSGPRAYDFRHTYAVHRLTLWYQQDVDIAAKLPWLSAYMGHLDLRGTERYLRATPELLEIASQRFAARWTEAGDQG